MRCTFFLAAFIFMTMSSLGALAAGLEEKERSNDGWTQLFDGKSLGGWYIKIKDRPVNEDPQKFFQVEDGAIHVYKDQAAGSAVASGYIATEAEYANYQLRMEYKWGEKKFKPRVDSSRDAGLLYHMQRPDTVWPRSVECQIQEGDVGDCFTVRGVRLTTSVEVVPIKTPGGMKDLPRYKPEADGGKMRELGDSGIVRIVKSHKAERDGWNTVEVTVRGSKSAEHLINGETVFRAKNLETLSSPLDITPKKGDADAPKWKPLGQGRIALQCEYAEVYYRHIRIRPIGDGAFRVEEK